MAKKRGTMVALFVGAFCSTDLTQKVGRLGKSKTRWTAEFEKALKVLGRPRHAINLFPFAGLSSPLTKSALDASGLV